MTRDPLVVKCILLHDIDMYVVVVFAPFVPLDSARIQTVQHPAEKHLPITTQPFEELSAVK